jgi:hypothetical protein
MKEKKPQQRVELPLLHGPEINSRPLKKPLSADDLASRDYREYVKKLDERRKQEEERGNASGQNKP